MKDFFQDEIADFFLMKWPFVAKIVITVILVVWSYIYFNTPTNILNTTYKWADTILPSPLWATPTWFIWLAYDHRKHRKNQTEQPQQKVMHRTASVGFILLALFFGIPLLSLLLILIMCLFGMCISV